MINRIAGVMAVFGFLLVFGAVGGMDNPDQAEFLLEQIAAAALGLGLMLLGVIGMERSDER